MSGGLMMDNELAELNYRTTESDRLMRPSPTSPAQQAGFSRRLVMFLVVMVVVLLVALVIVTATADSGSNNNLWRAMGLVEEEDCIDSESLIAIIFPTILNECTGCDIAALCNLKESGSDGCFGGWVRFDRVFLENGEEGAMVTVNISGYVPGSEHAWHVHISADASGGDGFTLGGHFNPFKEDHGCPIENGTHRHVGDMGNVVANEKGRVEGVYYFDMMRFYGEASINGRSIIFFQDPDECTTMAAGFRWGYGLIGACDDGCQEKFQLNSTVGDCFPEDWDCGDGVDFPYPCCNGLKCVIEDEETQTGTCEIDPGM